MTETSIEIKGLSRAFGDVAAVAGLDLTVPAGQITALLGPSGCGKTTTLRMLAGFEQPDAGTIEVGGVTVYGNGRSVPPEKRRIGMVFQEYALFPHFDVAANVAYGLRPGAQPGRVDELLALVGLAGLGSRTPHEISGGQQQRVALARALASDPVAILLDEPFSNLDATLRQRVRGDVRRILLDAGVTSLIVTHDQEEALSIADTVAVMRDGAIAQLGSPEEVYSRPASRWVADFLGDADVIPGTALADGVECALGKLPVTPGFEGAADVIVRPESVALAAGGSRPRGTVLPAEVVARDFYGHDQVLHLEIEGGLRLRSRRPGFPAWHPGDRVHVWLDGPVTVLPALSRN